MARLLLSAFLPEICCEEIVKEIFFSFFFHISFWCLAWDTYTGHHTTYQTTAIPWTMYSFIFVNQHSPVYCRDTNRNMRKSNQKLSQNVHSFKLLNLSKISIIRVYEWIMCYCAIILTLLTHTNNMAQLKQLNIFMVKCDGRKKTSINKYEF